MMKSIKNKISLAFLALFFLSIFLISGCQTTTGMYDARSGSAYWTSGYTLPFNFGALTEDTDLIISVLTLALMTIIIFLLAENLFIFRNNRRAAIVFAAIVSLIAIITTPMVQWVAMIISSGIWAIVVLLIVGFVIVALTRLTRMGHGHLQDEATLMKQKKEQSKDRREKADASQIFKRFRGYLNDIESEMDKVQNDVDSGTLQPGTSEYDHALRDLEAVFDSIIDAVKVKATSEGVWDEIKPVSKFITKAKGKVVRGDFDGARGFIGKAERRLKKFRKTA